MTTPKKLTIAMSERSPVQIDPAAWPLIASASRHDGKVRCQANTEWSICVREHEDGRRIVYGMMHAGGGGQYAGFRGASAGYLLHGTIDDAGRVRGEREREQETIRAIRRVAGVIGDEKLGAECIADLPAEEL